jgi:hypothetical protein
MTMMIVQVLLLAVAVAVPWHAVSAQVAASPSLLETSINHSIGLGQVRSNELLCMAFNM